MINGADPDDPTNNAGVESILQNGPHAECNRQGLDGSADLYTQVDDSCCSSASWQEIGHGPSLSTLDVIWSYSGENYTCPIMQLGPSAYVRGYGDCKDDGPVWAESCKPAGVGDWPMPDAETANQYWENGDHASCGCPGSSRLFFEGCYVGATFPGFAYFFSVNEVSCDYRRKTQVV